MKEYYPLNYMYVCQDKNTGARAVNTRLVTTDCSTLSSLSGNSILLKLSQAMRQFKCKLNGVIFEML